MSLRLNCVLVLGLAVMVSPLGASSGFAQTPAAPAPKSLNVQIAEALSAKASTAAFKKLSKAEKLAAVQAIVAEVLSESGASPDQVAAALVQAVASGVISGGAAIQIASAVSPQTAQTVAAAPAVVQQVANSNQTAVVTASTNSAGAPTVLVSLQGAATSGSGTPGGATTTTTAPFDPCAGVIAAYCGS